MYKTWRTKRRTVEHNSQIWPPKPKYDLVEDAISISRLSTFVFLQVYWDIDRPGNTKRDQQRQPNYRVGHLVCRTTVHRYAYQRRLGCRAHSA